MTKPYDIALLVLLPFTIFFSAFWYEVANIDDVNQTVKEIIKYVTGKSETLPSNQLTAREITHLQDVQVRIGSAIRLAKLFLLITGVVLLWTFIKKKETFVKTVMRSSIFTLSLLALCFFVASLSFSSVFYRFHQVAFSNEYWLLPPGATLLKLFPEAFFFNVLKNILINSIMVALLLFFVTYLVRRLQKKKAC